MLPSKDFGRCHQASLKSVINSQQHGHRRHNGFTTAHIALHQAVHLFFGGGIHSYFAQDSFLSISERKGQTILIKLVKQVPHFFKLITALHNMLKPKVSNLHLHQKKLFPLETISCLLQQLFVFGKMNMTQCFIATHQSILLQNRKRQKFDNICRL